MFDNSKLLELTKLAEKSIDELQGQINLFDLYLQETIKSVSEEDKKEVEKVRAISTQAFELAKMGKANEAQELIKKFEDERKGNK